MPETGGRTEEEGSPTKEEATGDKVVDAGIEEVSSQGQPKAALEKDTCVIETDRKGSLES